MARITPACFSILVAGLIPVFTLGVVGCLAPVVAAPPSMAVDPLRNDGDQHGAGGFPDPLEPVNRATFAFNRQFDRFFFAPITRVYRFMVPPPARRALRRALTNLDAPVTFANDVLQLEPHDAAVTAVRFVINTTVGIAGFFDVADTIAGLPGHESDFGQTLALAGVPSGPYLIVPMLGPGDTRDTAGYVVDFLFRPTTYLITPAGQVILLGLAKGGQVLFPVIFEGSTEVAHALTTRELAGKELGALEASAIDYYAVLRNAYYQTRTASIWRRGPDRGALARVKQTLAAVRLNAPATTASCSSTIDCTTLPAEERDMELRMGMLRVVSALVAIVAVASVVPTHAQTQGMERRDDRQDNRAGARDVKQDCKAGDEKSRAECRQDKRDTKQDGRQDGGGGEAPAAPPAP